MAKITELMTNLMRDTMAKASRQFRRRIKAVGGGWWQFFQKDYFFVTVHIFCKFGVNILKMNCFMKNCQRVQCSVIGGRLLFFCTFTLAIVDQKRAREQEEKTSAKTAKAPGGTEKAGFVLFPPFCHKPLVPEPNALGRRKSKCLG
jgi:hypothetical protein